MWRDPRNASPTLTYGRVDGRADRLTDRVDWLRDGRPRRVDGVNRLDPTRPGHLYWRGAGLLWPLRSHWCVLIQQADLAVIAFSRTWVTPAGIDVLSRHPAVDPADVEHCLDSVDRHPAVCGRRAGLRAPPY